MDGWSLSTSMAAVHGRAGPTARLIMCRLRLAVRMWDDVKAALRSLRASKSFTFAALIVLTLGIGATTAIFSVVDAVVLRRLPFEQHDRLVAIGERSATAVVRTDDPDRLGNVSPQNYLDWSSQQQVFESIAAIASGWLT